MEAIEGIAWILAGALGVTFLTSLWVVSKKPKYQTDRVSKRELED